ncbi:competence protein ComE, partial [Yersinia pestis]
MKKIPYRIDPTWINLLLSCWLGFISIGTAHATATDYMEW